MIWARFFKILLDIPSYPAVFFNLRDFIMFITSASKTGIISVCTLFPGLKLFRNFKALQVSLINIKVFGNISIIFI